MSEIMIDSNLNKIRNKFIEKIKESEYVLGTWNFGSETYGLSDAYSDVDIILLVDGRYFDEFSSSLDEYMKQICDKVLLCWPEGFNCAKIINNGYLLVSKNNIYQFDVVLLNSEKLSYFMCRLFYSELKEKDVYFDKKGLVKELIESDTTGSPWSDDIKRLDKTYWFYAYMTIKYLKREDYFKLKSTLQTMFETHSSMLLTGYDTTNWGGRENKLHFIPKEKQTHLKKYDCSEDFSKIKENLIESMKQFQMDAKEVHELKNVSYSTNLGDRLMGKWKEMIYNYL